MSNKSRRRRGRWRSPREWYLLKIWRRLNGAGISLGMGWLLVYLYGIVRIETDMDVDICSPFCSNNNASTGRSNMPAIWVLLAAKMAGSNQQFTCSSMADNINKFSSQNVQDKFRNSELIPCFTCRSHCIINYSFFIPFPAHTPFVFITRIAPLLRVI